jgi:hypothetical protein
MPLNVVPLADGTLNIAMKRAAVTNIRVARNFQVSIDVSFTRDNGILREFKQSLCEARISAGRIIIVVNGLGCANEPFARD